MPFTNKTFRWAWSSIHIVWYPASVFAENWLYCVGLLELCGYINFVNFTNCPRTFGGHCMYILYMCIIIFLEALLYFYNSWGELTLAISTSISLLLFPSDSSNRGGIPSHGETTRHDADVTHTWRLTLVFMYKHRHSISICASWRVILRCDTVTAQNNM